MNRFIRKFLSVSLILAVVWLILDIALSTHGMGK